MEMKFSQRIRKTPVKTEIQLESMDDDLRIGLWNVFTIYCIEEISEVRYISSSESWHNFFRSLWYSFFKFSLDTLPIETYKIHEYLKNFFMNNEWYKVYDFIEFVIQRGLPYGTDKFKDSCNNIMRLELSGYRIVDNWIAEITKKEEIIEIEEAIENAKRTKLSGVNKHLQSALAKLTDRKKPDYVNSIKESISAVESISRIITNDPKATLGKTLKAIDEKILLHPALKKGFMAIYGYTSDEDGIRHSMLKDPNLDFEDAKYMLVSCSAFINYLIVKVDKSGISLK